MGTLKRSRRKFSSSFKSKVVIEALKERESLQELALRYELHVNQISKWKQEFLSNSSIVFTQKNREKDDSINKDELYSKIGRLEMENEFLKKNLNLFEDL
ncbi:transposase [Halosquirtibacter laminarini]|uniref:Transposase n=2 Tax=Halosquirtibacter laminarini TaxID=3374600 RepID=A0AC61NN59_9BACT|nr:transposase [Prolixibacteraceae bacterium]QZE13940.1 transposase [Prolixibacteraceae bacterium]